MLRPFLPFSRGGNEPHRSEARCPRSQDHWVAESRAAAAAPFSFQPFPWYICRRRRWTNIQGNLTNAPVWIIKFNIVILAPKQNWIKKVYLLLKKKTTNKNKNKTLHLHLNMQDAELFALANLFWVRLAWVAWTERQQGCMGPLSCPGILPSPLLYSIWSFTFTVGP